MEHKKLIVKALKHFIRYNKNRGEISLNRKIGRRLVSGLCSYVSAYSERELDIEDQNQFQIFCLIDEEFRLQIMPYLQGNTWLSTKGRVTKKRLYVAQMIINKLEKQLKRC
jgi:hypothetical protein